MLKIIDFDIDKEEYFYKGIKKITYNKNMGYLSAFYNSKINAEGIKFNLEKLKEIFQEFEIITNWDILPKDFCVTIKYSPINLFKRWIFSISNKSFYKVYEHDKVFSKYFFLYYLDNQLFFFPITTNITHERFLLLVYTKGEFKENNITFTTVFASKRKLVIYKDYGKRKISTINFPRNFKGNRPYTFKVSVIKSAKKIRFKVYVVGHDYHTIHSIKLSGDKLHDSNGKNNKGVVGQVALNKFRKEVFEILKENHKKKLLTNKFANVSLGRVNKKPVLINLSKNYANCEIESIFKEKEEVFIIMKKKELIKTFTVSFAPKSNWLEKA